MANEKREHMDEKIEYPADRVAALSASDAALTRRILLKLDFRYAFAFLFLLDV